MYNKIYLLTLADFWCAGHGRQAVTHHLCVRTVLQVGPSIYICKSQIKQMFVFEEYSSVHF